MYTVSISRGIGAVPGTERLASGLTRSAARRLALREGRALARSRGYSGRGLEIEADGTGEFVPMPWASTPYVVVTPED